MFSTATQKNHDKKDEASFSSLRLFFRMWKTYYGVVPNYFNIAILLSFFTATLPFLLSKVQGNFIDKLIESLSEKHSLISIYPFLGVLILVYLLSSVVKFVFDFYIKVKLFYPVLEYSVALISKKKGSLDLGFYDNPKNMTLLTQADDAQTLVGGHFIFIFESLFVSVIAFVAALIIVAGFSYVIIVILTVSLIPFIWILYQSSTEEVRRWKGKTLLKKHTGAVREMFGLTKYLTEMKIFNVADKLVDRYLAFRKIIDDELVEMSERYLVLKIGGSAIRYIGIGIAILLLVQKTVAGVLSVGQMTFYLSTIFAFSTAAQALFTNIARFRQELLQISTAFEFLDIPPKFSGSGVKMPVFEKAPQIDFNNVSFGYNPENTIINNVSFSICSGEKVALVGLNGAGKSTIVKLLCRAYDPVHGSILINGEPLAHFDPLSWYKNISTVFQDYGRYEFTVEESVGLFDLGSVDIEKVKNSTKVAQISSKIESFENKYVTQLGTKFPGGVELSVGQWQKLAIARALYKDSKIIILDEPTSSIDAEAEEEIFNQLHALGSDTTLVFVSHRFSTIRQADKIIFVVGGQIDCVGSHDHLMEHSSEYKKLYELQSKAYS